MKKFLLVVCLLGMAVFLHAQADRGTITGTITDQTGAVVPKAKVSATNPATGTTFTTESTDTGNFTLPQMTVGSWNVVVDMPGFKKYTSEKTPVQVAQTVRLEIVLQLGSSSESVTVEAQTIALKTDSGDQSTTVSNEQIAELPINWTNGMTGNQAVRNPLSISQLMPGVSGGTTLFGWATQTSGGSSINGAPPGTFKVLLEGQDSSTLYAPALSILSQTSVEALQEFTLQASNYAAEFGQAQGGIFNFTTKSGTNSFHGGLFFRGSNEALNAHQAFSGVRVPSRQNNYGGTIGGPISIPRLYDGRNKTFFFFSFEGFNSVIPAPTSGQYTTVPNAEDRAGNFLGALGPQVTCGGKPCVDALNNPVFAGQIYDPKTLGSDGVTRLAFPNNTIPLNRMDPTALKIQSFLPTPTNSLRANNYLLSQSAPRPQYIPSLKIDHNLTDKLKISGFGSGQWADTLTTPDGLPNLVSQGRPNYSWSHTERLSLDYTLRPTMLLHLGSGYVMFFTKDIGFPEQMSFDQSKLGLTGAIDPGFPSISGLANTAPSTAPIGGMASTVGARFNDDLTNGTFTSTANLSWISGPHSYKFGAAFGQAGSQQTRCDNGWGRYGFNAIQTNQPALQGLTSNGTPGLAYASFLLGLTNTASIAPCLSVNWRTRNWSAFAQDTWKVTRKLTLDYGLRYDYQEPPYEGRNRISSFSTTVVNPSADNRLGGLLYQGFGPNTCNCQNLLATYKFGLGPRIAAAYQINSKTVIRASWGLFYGTPWTFLSGPPQQGGGTGVDAASYVSLGNGLPALPNGLQGGIPFTPSQFAASRGLPGAFPTLNPVTKFSNLDLAGASTQAIDRNLGRPPRTSQYNISLQRELRRGVTIEGAYVGNRGVWLQDSMLTLNAVTPAILAANGLNLANASDRTLLGTALSNASVKAAGFKAPFSTYPVSQTLAASLRPYPQFSSALGVNGARGKSWYDSLQVKLNARIGNLSLLSTYTWSKSLTQTAPFNDFTNMNIQKRLDSNMLPQALQISLTYQVPYLKSGRLGSNMITRQIFSGWTVSAVTRYQSGDLITAPVNVNTPLTTYLPGAPAQYQARVAGQPLFLVDPNSDFDPTKQLLLNPKAWADCGGVGTFGCGAPMYGDFRQRRVPQEQLGLGRRFALGENGRRYFEIRMDMINVFNRLVYPNLTVGSSIAAPSTNSAGQLIGGFGFVNYNNVSPTSPRNMLFVGRLQF